MIDRMKKDLIAQQIETHSLTESLNDKQAVLQREFEKSQRARELHLQSKAKLDKLMKNIDREQEKRQERIQSLQNSIKNKEEAVQRRMERANKQKQIA
jgi:outer membrane protein assembly factor BamE (lipoprotein component of BamABCDE complex)